MGIMITEMLGPYVAPLIFHAVGDYVTQSDWMAQQKTKSIIPAAAHALIYSTPFLLLTQSWVALLFIAGTHFVIDHWRLARYVCWAKNFLAPRSYWPAPWEDCKATGYSPGTPPFMSIWLMIIADNVMHILCNAYAIKYL